ncbi:MAG TPA: Xaa-Pro peptidase family protein [Planctomycetaceae bacterium]|nr:Xaa-Pro peptidase family protein [Planctomycetaceae bacterium]
MSTEIYVPRRKKLLKEIKQRGLHGMLVTDERNVTWLTGFRGDSTWLLISPNLTLLVSDSRYTTQIENECPGMEMHIRTNRVTLADAFAEVVGKTSLRNLGYESDQMTVATFEQIGSTIPSVEFAEMPGVIVNLRAIKDATEIAELRDAVDQAQRGHAVIRAALRPEQTELQVAHNLEHAMRSFGAVGVAFDPIIAVGQQAALPHARPGNRKIGDDPVLLTDWGAQSAGGYRSDLTRTYFTGKKMTKKFAKIYEIVLKAQLAAISRIRPGAKCVDVDSAARNVIEKAGYGKNFGHGLGHGIGLNIHENPRFSPISKDLLHPGMVVTVEPGIYLPDWGGIRIEDDVLVTKDGHEVLTVTPKSLEDTQIG